MRKKIFWLDLMFSLSVPLLLLQCAVLTSRESCLKSETGCHDVLLMLCRTSPAQNITCTVTEGGGLTTYSLSDVEEPQCDYSWANVSDTGHSVIAHQEGKKDEVVRSKNISTLITSTCFDRIIYDRRCVSEGLHFTVNCTTNCSGKETSQVHTIVAVVVVLVLVVIVVIYKRYIHKKTRGSYTPGRADVEEGQISLSAS